MKEEKDLGESGQREGKECLLRRACPKRGSLYFGIVLLVFAVLLLVGCGKHKCAICGEEAEDTFHINGKEFHICRECYQTYVEERNLFEEEL